MKFCSEKDCDREVTGRGLCKKHYQKLPEIYEKRLKWQRENKEARKRILSSYHKSEKYKKTIKKYRATKKGRANKRANWQNYHTRKLKAMPKWVNKKEIEEVYYNCPDGFHVDHIIPLKGKEVSGLHVPWNLQYLTPSENSIKSNKLFIS